MGGTQGSPPEPEDQAAPDPSITVEQFREQFTEEMRNFLWEAIECHRKALIQEYMSGGGNSRAEAGIQARAAVWPGMRALQLIHALHPQPYTPIGECPNPAQTEVINEHPR